jgi:adenylyltransferase/sulfurtransferase
MDPQRYARHLSLGGFGALGQGRLARGAVRVVGHSRAAEEAALYLVAAGVGRVELEFPLAQRLAERLAELNPEVTLGAAGLGARVVTPRDGARRADGAKAALAAVLELAGLKETDAPWDEPEWP